MSRLRKTHAAASEALFTSADVKATANMAFFPATKKQFRFVLGLCESVDVPGMLAAFDGDKSAKEKDTTLIACLESGLDEEALSMKGLIAMDYLSVVINSIIGKDGKLTSTARDYALEVKSAPKKADGRHVSARTIS